MKKEETREITKCFLQLEAFVSYLSAAGTFRQGGDTELTARFATD